jgi:hypothetical protein
MHDSYGKYRTLRENLILLCLVRCCKIRTVVKESIGLWGRIYGLNCDDYCLYSVLYVRSSIGLWGRIWRLLSSSWMLIVVMVLKVSIGLWGRIWTRITSRLCTSLLWFFKTSIGLWGESVICNQWYWMYYVGSVRIKYRTLRENQTIRLPHFLLLSTLRRIRV